MSPNLIDQHEKNLYWPDSVDMDSGHFVWIGITSSDGKIYNGLLEDYQNKMASIYVRDELSGDHIASYVLSFELTPPSDLGTRIPQVESAYVDPEYQGGGITVATYKAIIEHYGAVISDTHQTEDGMLLWLFGIPKENSLEITPLTVIGDRCEFRTDVAGQKLVYQADIRAMLAVADTIWGNPDSVPLTDPAKLGFTPTWRNLSDQVLAAKKAENKHG
ncbi:hypothetical protein [Pantoea cypripedii]|uniref:Uncharacterized protein n=1 Tax=Pantoea cypripedii TaxID=55209 RepID=A0A6B9G8C0_PANCY|nr:hypothetical protein [Pantoea cypripedii]QGY28336.1 hypothetical protein CUN67_05035 [Pantoea cypripedii]